MESLKPSTVGALLFISFSAIPLSRTFQLWSPDAWTIMLGGYASLISLPCVVYMTSTQTCKSTRNMAMLFSPFVFASVIDLLCSLEYDKLIAGYMSFYLVKAEPYLDTAYNAAICYWDAVVHYVLYWLMLYTYSNRMPSFRAISLYWFGTLFTSLIVLILGSLAGPFTVHWPILLNLTYIFAPVGYLMWILHSTTPHKTADSPFSRTTRGQAVRVMFAAFFILFIVAAFCRGLAALGANRPWLDLYINMIEKPVRHPHTYPKVTLILYLLYGCPLYIHSIYCLVANRKSSLVVDLSLIGAGFAANAQVGYMGPYLIARPDELKFDELWCKYLFWTYNLLQFVVPHVFAIYCYSCYRDGGRSGDSRRKVKSR